MNETDTNRQPKSFTMSAAIPDIIPVFSGLQVALFS